MLVVLHGAVIAPDLRAESMAEWDQHQREKDEERKEDETRNMRNPDWFPSQGVAAGLAAASERAMRMSRPGRRRRRSSWKRSRAEKAEREAAEACEQNQQERADAAQAVADAQAELDKAKARDAECTGNCARLQDVFKNAAPGSPEAAAALSELQGMVKEGFARPWGLYGWMLIEGQFVPKNLALGKELLLDAVYGGDRISIARLGFCYQRGLGVPADMLEARLWYRTAIACDAPMKFFAQRCLGIMDEAGLGAHADLQAALRWYHAAAESGDAWSSSSIWSTCCMMASA